MDREDDDGGVDFDKITALMANFYGVSELDDEGGDNSAFDVDNIDSSAFDASAYVLRAVRDNALSDLLRTDETLITEVQELNNDMQNLVYENYNKFISATDTIRKMKDQVEGMETEIETLMKSMDSVGKRSNEINAKLQPKRERVENIQSLQRLIKRLEFLFELPLRLRRSIELEAYTQAVKYYNMASGILEKHSEVASFGAIQKESNEIMEKLKTNMYKHLEYNSKTKSRVLSENIKLLIQLGENKNELSNTFLIWHKQRLIERITSLTNCFNNSDDDDDDDDDDNDNDNKNMNLNNNSSGTTIISSSTEEKKDPYQAMWYANSTFLSDMNMFLESHDELFGNNGNIEQKKEKDLSCGHHTMVRELFSDYFRVIRAHLLRHPLPLSNNEVLSNKSIEKDDGFHPLLSTLGRFKSELRESTILLRPAKVRLGDRAAEIIENTIRAQMNRAFISLRTVFQSRIHGKKYFLFFPL
jgi:hypothetical protein